MSPEKIILVFKILFLHKMLFNKVSFGTSGAKTYLAPSPNDSAVRSLQDWQIA